MRTWLEDVSICQCLGLELISIFVVKSTQSKVFFFITAQTALGSSPIHWTFLCTFVFHFTLSSLCPELYKEQLVVEMRDNSHHVIYRIFPTPSTYTSISPKQHIFHNKLMKISFEGLNWEWYDGSNKELSFRNMCVWNPIVNAV